MGKHGWMVGVAGAAAMMTVVGCGDDGRGTTTGFTTLPQMTEASAAGTTTAGSSSDGSAGSSGTTGGSDTPTTTGASSTAVTGETSGESSGGGPVCGDGVLAGDEACDAGPDNADDGACTSQCAVATCGDGLVQAGVEGCDDGNVADGDGCAADCTLESCGNGEVEAPEACDDGNTEDADACRNTCEAAACGDGVLYAEVEACDDGDLDDDDGCLATCVVASCGDAAVWAGMEACDDGDADEVECTMACVLPTCMDTAQNGVETDVDCGGAACPKCAVAKKCAVGGDCASGLCTANVCAPPPSCKAVLAADPAAPSGKYNLDLDGAGPLKPYNGYCDMTSDGGGWTVFYAASGADAEQVMVSDAELTLNDPLAFQTFNLNRARKIALSQISTATIFVRAGNVWLRADKPAFDANLIVPNTTAKGPVMLTTSDAVTVPGFMGYANYGYIDGGDFGLSLAPDAATCSGVTAQGFDHHGANYRMLNCGCQRHYLYSYSASGLDSDAGYDVNTGLGAWTATAGCDGTEGGALKFYAAMR